MLLVLSTSAVEVKESLHFRIVFVFRYFPETYTKNEVDAAIANTLKRAPDRKGGGVRKKRLEVDFSADETENGNMLIGLEEDKDTSIDSFDEI